MRYRNKYGVSININKNENNEIFREFKEKPLKVERKEIESITSLTHLDVQLKDCCCTKTQCRSSVESIRLNVYFQTCKEKKKFTQLYSSLNISIKILQS